MAYTFDLLTQIHDMYNLFSPVEEKVASYVIENAHDVINQSITDLAEKCNVSVSTVSRFCRHVSLNGYQEFRVELVRSLSNQEESPSSQQRDISPEDTVPDMFSKMSTLYEDTFNKVLAGLDPVAFSRVCDMIVAAKDVHFIGTGNMLPIALAANLQFMEVSTKFRCLTDASAQALSTALMTEDSLVIVYSFSGEALSGVQVARFAKKSNAKVVAITRYVQSPLVSIADEVLICNVSHTTRMSSSLALCSGFQFITDLLYTEFFRRNTEVCKANQAKSIGRIIGHS
mgnify:CR=1 FL=1